MRGKYYQMKKQKIVIISDEQANKLEFLKKLFDCSENTVFRIALEKLYKEYKE